MKKIFLFLFLLLSLSACTSIPPAEQETVRKTINQREKDILQRLSAEDPEFKKALAKSKGYFTGKLTTTDLFILGGGQGIGVLVDKKDDSRTYLNVNRINIGPGLGVGKFSLVILFFEEAPLEEFKKGIRKSGVGIESMFWKKGTDLQSLSEKEYAIYMPSESGASASVGLRSIRLSVNEDLNPSPVSTRAIPHIIFEEKNSTNQLPRIWEYKLPFLAQNVIDEGYDLPLPYGIGMTYAHVKQDFEMGNLFVGLNGGHVKEYDWVSFENAEVINDTYQLQMDCWIFPFMNVFGTVGRLDGRATLDVLLDLGGPFGTVKLPVKPKFSGTTYGLGTVLAGGWNNWFVVIPLNATYADMDTTKTEGLAYTITPRVGYTLDLNRLGDLSLFTGGNFLDTSLTVSGHGTLSMPGSNDLEIDYRVEQKNTDQWNGVVGFNWDLNKHLSWSLEYNGFFGSRTAIITLLTWRL